MGKSTVMCSVYGALPYCFSMKKSPENLGPGARGEAEGSKDAHSRVPDFGSRLGLSPIERGCAALENCPDIWAASNGDFFVIGRDVTADVEGRLPPSAGCGVGERVVLIPRAVLVAAKAAIPRA